MCEHNFIYDEARGEIVCKECGHVLTAEEKRYALEYANNCRRAEEQREEMTVVTIFDRPYTPEKQAEGQAVSWAVANMLCFKCGHYFRCSVDTTFVPPEDTFCMRKKAEILEAMKGGGE